LTQKSGGEQASLWLTSPGISTRIHGSPALQQAALQKIEQLASQFLELAAGGELDTSDDFSASPNAVEIQRLAELVDANHDGRATAVELGMWRQFTEQALRTQVVVTIVDFQTSLFSCLDENNDGALSPMELDESAQRLRSSGVERDGHVNVARLPRQLRICVSLGNPSSLLDARHSKAPGWFNALDRNRDGVVSRGEFLGTDEQFVALDTNADGTIAPSEAQVAKANPEHE
jgi:hypothetical protein